VGGEGRRLRNRRRGSLGFVRRLDCDTVWLAVAEPGAMESVCGARSRGAQRWECGQQRPLGVRAPRSAPHWRFARRQTRIVRGRRVAQHVPPVRPGAPHVAGNKFFFA
jgi:hypothetical protein